MSEAPVWFVKPSVSRAPVPEPARLQIDHGPSVEVVAPDPGCAALLVEYAASTFPAEIVAGSTCTVRLRPSPGAGWVLELLALVERWLEAAALPSVTVLYGGRGYLIRDQISQPSALRTEGAE